MPTGLAAMREVRLIRRGCLWLTQAGYGFKGARDPLPDGFLYLPVNV